MRSHNEERQPVLLRSLVSLQAKQARGALAIRLALWDSPKSTRAARLDDGEGRRKHNQHGLVLQRWTSYDGRQAMSTPPKNWEETMTPKEVAWCERAIGLMVESFKEPCVDNWRAARIWKSSQRRRFRKQERSGCCGSYSWIAHRWSQEKRRYDIYLLGFNFGH